MSFLYILFNLFVLSFADKEYDLRNRLFSDYNKFIVPNNNSVNLNIGIEIKSLEYFNQKAEKIKFNMILNEQWYDTHFTWSNTIDQIIVNDDLIWKPDLELYNAASSPEVYENIHVKIYRDGFIRWNRPILYSFSCPLNLIEFPFDKQKCSMTFGSWKFSSDYVSINLLNDSIKISNDFSHNEWNIINTKAIHKDLEYLCCPGLLWSINQFEIELERNSNKFVISIIMAVMLTVSAIVMTTFSIHNYKRPYVLIFIPLSIIWIQIDISSKIPVIEYETKIEKIMLLCFLTCMLCAFESVIAYCILTDKNLFIDNNKNIIEKVVKNHKKKYDIIKFSDKYHLLKKDNVIRNVKYIDKIFRYSIYSGFVISLFILLYI